MSTIRNIIGKMRVIFYCIGYVLNKLDSIKNKYLEEKKLKQLMLDKSSGVKIGSNVNIVYPQNISIGHNTYINGGDIIASENASITIGNNCIISYYVHIRTDMHNYKDINQEINKQGHTEANINIGNDVWIGYGAQIMSGVNISDGCVIASGAIVTHDTEPFGVYAGVPAVKIGERSEE